MDCWQMIRDLRPSSDDIRTVLVVEDEILVRIVIAEELRDAGMRVIEVGSADEAMAHLRAGHKVDVVFTDIELPGSMNGFELARRLQADFPELKLLMTSGRLPALSRLPAAVYRQAIQHRRRGRPHPRRAG